MLISKDTIKQAAVYLLPWVLAGLLLRLWLTSLRLVMFRDETTYAYQIRHALEGTLFQDPTYYTFPPMFALLAAPIAHFTNDAELAGRLVSSMAGAATAVPVFYLAKGIFNLRTAAVAAAVTAFLPPMTSVGVMSEPTYGFFLALGACLAARACRLGRMRDFALFGAALAAAYLSRPEGFFVFFACLGFAVVLLVRSGAGRRKALALSGAALVGFFVLALPYMVQLRVYFGAWEISGKTRINLAKMKAQETAEPGVNIESHEAKVYKDLEEDKKSFGGNVMAELAAMSKRYPANISEEARILARLAGYPLGAAFFAGLAFALAGPGRVRRLWPLLAAPVPLLLIPTVFVLERIIVPYLPFFVIVAAYGVDRAAALLAGKGLGGRVRAAAPAAASLMAAGLVMGGYGDVLPDTDMEKVLRENGGYRYYYELRAEGEKLRPFLRPGTKVITRNNIFAYYAGCEYMPMPYTDLPGLMEYAQSQDAQYLFCGPMELELRPQLTSALLNNWMPVQDPCGDGSLKLVYSDRMYFLYRFCNAEGG